MLPIAVFKIIPECYVIVSIHVKWIISNTEDALGKLARISLNVKMSVFT